MKNSELKLKNKALEIMFKKYKYNETHSLYTSKGGFYTFNYFDKDEKNTGLQQLSAFQPTAHVSNILPQQNKPVDGDAMQLIKTILLGTDSFKLARHLTFVDCKVMLVLWILMLLLLLA